MEPSDPSVMQAFADLPDPRWHRCRHRLDEILLCTLNAVLCGAEDWETISLWGNSQLA